jgi:hypothetical protein
MRAGAKATSASSTSLFESLQANQAKAELERADSKLGSAAILPMADSALVMLLITIGIIQIIGGYVDGI